MPAENPYYGNEVPAGPATSAAVVTPSDNADLSRVSRSLYVGTAGDLRVTFVDDAQPVPFVGLAAGLYPFAVARVWSTGTTASNIVAVR
ncbi:spike base protein, RCAP_Rcc01079 family [Terrihabitans rhizophilus]|uniref:DUF1929 domain-containing protein n=1 Tax=Terrihabitans rhizophilus TaxID=3092662 RepID=A0ABU4RN95_9HYPH|nr:hypothetical protein [Terrihabitans sp. PJ23]MDX6806297.1 hypothetical protein [Terrihabitans sp. PJ23]